MLQAGMHHDGLHFFALPRDSRSSSQGLLAINHEYTDDGLLHSDGYAGWSAEKVRKSQAAHGVSVVEVRRDSDQWTVVRPSPLAPGLPSAAEAGVPGYECLSLTGVFAPKKTSAELLQLLNRQSDAVLSRVEVRDRFVAAAMETGGGSAARFADTVQGEIVRLGKLINARARADLGQKLLACTQESSMVARYIGTFTPSINRRRLLSRGHKHSLDLDWLKIEGSPDNGNTSL
jgi:hypothetical protein